MPVHYAEVEMVKALAYNIKSETSTALMNALIRVIDTRINMRLSAIFDNWLDVQDGTIPVPEVVSIMASTLVAAKLEMTKFSVNEAGNNSPNPYGKQLEAEGMEMLEGIAEGSVVVQGLNRFVPFDEVAATGTFTPVTGLRMSGGMNIAGKD